MTDRDLLELAAKAAGIDRLDFGDGVILTNDEDGHTVVWNPLTDDGDALRLAVKLSMRIYVYLGHGDDCTTVASDEAYPDQVGANEFHNGDAQAATRRAITRAAAEIGKAMP